MDQLTRVFVYGSLRRSEPRHGALSEAVFAGLARTRPTFALYDLGAYPALVRGGEQAVVGELYDVDARTLARLDRIEGHPRFYRRELIECESGERAEAYLLRPEQVRERPLVRGGDWCAKEGREHEDRDA